MSIATRRIGNDEVNAIGYGAMGLSAFYSAPLPDEERFKVLDAAFEAGCNLFDTADCYNDNEELIGKWLKRSGKRDQIFLATKFGFVYTNDGVILNGSPEYVRVAFEKSLEKLGTDRIDLYYLHRADKNTPIEHTVAAMAELVKEGKVKYLGLSDVTSATLRRAHAVHPIAALQVEYSPFVLDIEEEKYDLLKTCRELGVKVVAYCPLGRGLLTGKYKGPEDFPEDDIRRSIPKFSKENFPNILKLTDKLQEIGQRHNATAGQATLAWLLGQGDDIIPIPGSSKIANLQENVGGGKITLTAEELKEVREAAENADALKGLKYPEYTGQFIYLDTPPLP